MKQSRAPDLVGARFGRWKVIARVPSLPGYKLARWQCRCECGGVGEVNGIDLRAGHSKSCGCLKSESSRANILKRNAMSMRLKPLDFQTGTDLAALMRRRLT